MDHIPMIIIVYGYTLDSKSSMANPDQSELVPTYFCENLIRSFQKESVPNLIFLLSFEMLCVDR